VDLKLGKTR